MTLDIKGNGATIDGENEATHQSYNQRGFFVYSGVVTLENMTIANTVARGGDGGNGLGGGGGGGGLGGGLFIANDSGSAVAGQVTLSGVSFNANSAIGGKAAMARTVMIRPSRMPSCRAQAVAAALVSRARTDK